MRLGCRFIATGWVKVASSVALGLGTQAANHSGLQFATIRNLLIAWVLTMPAAILLSGSLYWLFTRLF